MSEWKKRRWNMCAMVGHLNSSAEMQPLWERVHISEKLALRLQSQGIEGVMFR